MLTNGWPLHDVVREAQGTSRHDLRRTRSACARRRRVPSMCRRPKNGVNCRFSRAAACWSTPLMRGQAVTDVAAAELPFCLHPKHSAFLRLGCRAGQRGSRFFPFSFFFSYGPHGEVSPPRKGTGEIWAKPPCVNVGRSPEGISQEILRKKATNIRPP